MMDSKNKIQFDVKLHVWLEGDHRANIQDVYRRIAQHIINNAIQRRRTLCELPSEMTDNSYVIGIELTDAEQTILNRVQAVLVDIGSLKERIEAINISCNNITNDLIPILSNYLNELPNSED